VRVVTLRSGEKADAVFAGGDNPAPGRRGVLRLTGVCASPRWGAPAAWGSRPGFPASTPTCRRAPASRWRWSFPRQRSGTR